MHSSVGSSTRFLPRAGWTLLILILATRPFLSWTRLYDSDEFEHLHAAYCIANGMIPYRDFFEHHGPLDYYLLAPFVRILGPVPELLHVHRAISFAWSVVAVLAACWLTARLAGRAAAPWAGVWLLTFSWFAEKGIEGRPDVAAAALAALAACVLHRGCRSRDARLSAFLAGTLLGAATLFTLKAVFLALGMAAGAALTSASRKAPVLPALFAGLMGVLLPWVLIAAAFAAMGALGPFLDCVLVIPATWPAHEPDPSESVVARLVGRTEWSPGHVALAVGGLACVLFELARRRAQRRRGWAVPALGCLAHLLSLLVMPAAYLQFYLPCLPLFAVLAVRFIGRSSGLAACTSAAMFGGTLYWRWRVGEFRLDASNPYLVADVVAAAALLFAVFWILVGAAFRLRPAVRAALIGTIAVCCAPSAARIVFQHVFWSAAASQREQIRSFDSYGGPVLDGFSGLGCLKPHASYWWWLNQHSIPLLIRRGEWPRLLEVVRQGIPTIVIYDEHMARAGAELRRLVESRYVLVHSRGSRAVYVRPDILRQAP